MSRVYTRKDVVKADEFDYTGKIVVLDPMSLKPKYRKKKEQLVYAYDGHGCRSSNFGDKVFCYNINTQEMAVWSKWDILGELKEELITAIMLEKIVDFERNRAKILRAVLEDMQSGQTS